jgi:hypothetical protein
MARIITRELADKIAKKLKATIDRSSSKSHDMVQVFEDGVLITQFGIRRGSEKDKGHDHIPGLIGVGPAFAKLLGQCPKSRDQWLDAVREKGWLPD